jgi:predicted DNA-binding transcriptional regulator YafY
MPRPGGQGSLLHGRELRGADFNLEEFMRPSFGVFQGEHVKVRVGFAPDITGYVTEKVWHQSQKIHELDDGSVIFEADVADTDEVKFWIMNWGSKALVLEPKSLRDSIRSEVSRSSGNFVS